MSEYLKAEKRVVLEWFNPDCPFVKKHHLKNKTMARTFETFREDKTRKFENLLPLTANEKGVLSLDTRLAKKKGWQVVRTRGR